MIKAKRDEAHSVQCQLVGQVRTVDANAVVGWATRARNEKAQQGVKLLN